MTSTFRRALRRWQEIIKAQWAAGQFNGESLELTALANHKATSELGMIGQILDLDADDLEGIFENDFDK
jgi:hypothetical protein